MAFKIVSVVGARPNFMKIAAICEAIKESNRRSESDSIEHVLVHTGQHYDANMSDMFFNDLELPKPNKKVKRIINRTTKKMAVEFSHLLKKEFKRSKPKKSKSEQGTSTQAA